MEMVKSRGMTLVYCPGLVCLTEGWQYHSTVYFQYIVQSDSQTFVQCLPNAKLAFAALQVTESSMCHRSTLVRGAVYYIDDEVTQND